MRSLPALAVLILALGLATASAQEVAFPGLRTDTEAQVEVTADSLSVNQAKGTAVFTGNVLIVQGPMRLKAEKVEVEYGADRSKIAKLHASGGVTLASKTDAAEAREAVYAVATGAVEMTGDVLLTQGEGFGASAAGLVSMAIAWSRSVSSARNVASGRVWVRSGRFPANVTVAPNSPSEIAAANPAPTSNGARSRERREPAA